MIVIHLNHHNIYHTIISDFINIMIFKNLFLLHNNKSLYSSAYSVRYFASKACRN